MLNLLRFKEAHSNKMQSVISGFSSTVEARYNILFLILAKTIAQLLALTY